MANNQDEIEKHEGGKTPSKLRPREASTIARWKEKGESSPLIKLSKVDEQLLINANNCQGTPEEKNDLIASVLSEASGSKDMPFSLELMRQYVSVQAGNGLLDKIENASNSFLSSMVSLQPQDPIEGMLLTQILSLHTLGMSCTARAACIENSNLNVDRNVNNLTKLLRLQHETIETLNRYRRKGTQQVIVQHVNVNDGGQAVVGTFQQGGGGSSKK